MAIKEPDAKFKETVNYVYFVVKNNYESLLQNYGIQLLKLELSKIDWKFVTEPTRATLLLLFLAESWKTKRACDVTISLLKATDLKVMNGFDHEICLTLGMLLHLHGLSDANLKNIIKSKEYKIDTYLDIAEIGRYFEARNILFEENLEGVFETHQLGTFLFGKKDVLVKPIKQSELTSLGHLGNFAKIREEFYLHVEKFTRVLVYS